MFRGFCVAMMCLALMPRDALAQDWDKRYRNWRTAGYLSFVAPAVGVTSGVFLIAETRDAPVLIDVLLIGVGIGLAGTGFAAGTPLMSLSADRGRYVLRQQGLTVPGGFGTVSWVGTATSAAGVGTVLLSGPLESEAAIGAGLVGIVVGGALSYGGGMAQWGANRKARKTLQPAERDASQQRAFSVPLMQIGGQW